MPHGPHVQGAAPADDQVGAAAYLAAERSGNAPDFILFHDRDPRVKHREEEERRRALLAYEHAMQEVRDFLADYRQRLTEAREQADAKRTRPTQDVR